MFYQKIKAYARIFILGMLMFMQGLGVVCPVSAQNLLGLPAPGVMLKTSPNYTPAILNGIIINPDNPLQFDFIIDTGDDQLSAEALKSEAKNLISYFMATLTVPEDQMWVNLSPYEKNRIIAASLGKTLLGKDMLAQDYILKQLTASLMYPDDPLGSEFWQRINREVHNKFGNIELPMNTLNKVWIVPEHAMIYRNGRQVFVAESRLKVMLEQDYLALEHHDKGLVSQASADREMNQQFQKILREVLIPQIEREVNNGKHFAKLRQIYHSMILATWYKKNLKRSLLGKVYFDQNKISGIDLEDKNVATQIYNQYLEAFNKGVFSYIKEEYDVKTDEMIPHKYFSGGLALGHIAETSIHTNIIPTSSPLRQRESSSKVLVRVNSELSTSSSGIIEKTMVANDQFQTPEVRSIWEYIQTEIQRADPQIANKKEGVLARTYRQLNQTLYSIDQKVKNGKIKFVTDLNLLKSGGIASDDKKAPIHVGVFSLNANPIHWSNINSQLMLMDEENLGTIIFLPLGKLNEDGLPASHIASEEDRHDTSQTFLAKMGPLLQYSDLGRGTDLSEERLLQEFIKLNATRNMTIYYSAGTENEAHIKRVMENMIEGTQLYGFKQTNHQKLVLTFIPIDEHLAGSISDADLKSYLQEVATARNLTPADLPFSTELAVRDYDELGYTIHATLYRRGDRALVPSEFDQLAQEKGYYGYPKRELKDGQWTTISMDEAIAQRLTPLVDQLAQMIIKRFPEGNAVIAIDGQSASGKSVISKLLETRLKELLPQREISLFGLDAYLKDYDFRHAIEKWITNEPISEEELKLVPDEIKKSVSRGGIYDNEQDFFDNAAIEAKLREAVQFFAGQKEEGGLTIEHPYNHEGKGAVVKPLHIALKKGGILIAEGKYSNLPALQSITSLKIRVDDLMEAIRARYELRTRKRNPHDADVQLRFFNQSLAPSYDRYAAETRKQLDLIINMTSENPNVWQIVDNHASSAVQNPSQYGGIDLNPNNLNLTEQNFDNTINFNYSYDIPSNIINGLTPVIQSILPISNFHSLLTRSATQP